MVNIQQLLQKQNKKLVIISLSTVAVIISYGVFRMTQPTVALMCNSNGYALRIIDDSVTSEVRSIKSVGDPYFRSFITSLTDYIVAKFPGATPCKANSSEGAMINLIFVRLPLVTSGNAPLAPPPKLNTSLSNITCHLDSPWAKLAIRRSNNPMVHAIFIWNERQFLADQVLLSGQNGSLNSSLMPLSNRLFEQYAADYANSEILRSPSGENADNSISKRIPADILWLFRHSPQTTFIPFSSAASSTMNTTLKLAVGGYIHLTKKLFDRCFSLTQNSQQRYKTILDFRDIIHLNEYQIHQLN